MEPTNKIYVLGKEVLHNAEVCDLLKSQPLNEVLTVLYPDGVKDYSDTILLYQFIEGERELTAYDYILDVTTESDNSISAYFVLIKQRDIRQTHHVDSFEEGECLYLAELEKHIQQMKDF